MENTEKKEEPAVGIVGKAVAVLGGAGVAALAGSVGRSVKTNIRGALEPLLTIMDESRNSVKMFSPGEEKDAGKAVQ